MPDLSIVTMQMCAQLEVHQVAIGNYKQEFQPRDKGWSCTCKGWQFRRHCKHVTEAEKRQCMWHEQFDEPQTPAQSANQVCPRCGKSTVYVQVGV